MAVGLSRRGGNLRGENGMWETLGLGINDGEEVDLESRLSGKRKSQSYKKKNKMDTDRGKEQCPDTPRE